MSSNLKVNAILPATGVDIGIGTAGGTVTFEGTSVINVGTGASIHSPDSNTLTLGTNSAERFRIASGGHVGIATTNPQRRLEVYDGDIYLNSTDKKIFLTSDYDQYITANAASNYLILAAGNQERLRIASDGKTTYNTTGQVAAEFNTSHSSAAYHDYKLGASGARIGYIGAGSQLVTTSGNTDFAIRTENNFVIGTNGNNERLRITSAGKLGLGVASPASESGWGNILHINSASAGAHIRFTDNTSGSGAGDGSYIGHYGNDTYLVNKESSGVIIFNTNANERLRIGSAGQFGIGGANYGSSGQVLTSQGSGSAVAWATAAGGGKILQVVQEHRTDVWSESVAQGAKSGAAITKAITTSASNSKVLITISLTIGWNDQVGRSGVVLKRGGSEIALSDSTGDNKTRLLTCSEANGGQWCEPLVFTYLDSPGSAATHTYTAHLWHGYQNTFTAYLNRAGIESNNNWRGRGTSSIVLMEVSA